MKLLFKQRFSFGLDRFDIYNEYGDAVFTVVSRLAWGRKLEVYDRSGNLIGTLIGKVFTFLPTFEMYIGSGLVGTIQRKMTFFRPEFIIDYNGWSVSGDWIGWNYSINDSMGIPRGSVTKEFDWTDTYTLDIYDDVDALIILMIVIAIDAEKDNRD